LQRHLINSGFCEENALRRVKSGETTLAALAESNQAMIELLREMTVEGLYQIAHKGDEFEVKEGATTPYASPKAFDLEALIEDANRRKRDWEKVSELIPDLTGAISFRRDLGEREEVTVGSDDWKVLSEIGTGSPVIEIADKLGTTEFWTASVAARLVNNDLVVLTGSARAPHADEYAVDGADWEPESSQDDDAETTVDEYPRYVDEPVEDATPETPSQDEEVDEVFVSDDEVVDPGRSWWQEPSDEETPDVDDSHEKTPEVVREGLSEIPTVSDEDPSDLEGDTEAFLEKVFSELESTEESESEEGHGLLRRRRMGTLRDFSSDS
ncbi:MAG: hypothetical protein ACRDU9_10090, partial [Acidimicrobiia bacterium]